MVEKISREKKSLKSEIYGNNVAATCPDCSQVFICSAYTNSKPRPCPFCKKFQIRLVMDGTKIKEAYIEAATLLQSDK